MAAKCFKCERALGCPFECEKPMPTYTSTGAIASDVVERLGSDFEGVWDANADRLYGFDG